MKGQIQEMQDLITKRRVLVTGAGGSIGSELVRQIANYFPSEIILVENSEFNLYTVDMELSNKNPNITRHALIGDVRDRERIFQIFQQFKPELVFHAAALKHVPMVEYNVFECMFTNVIGKKNVSDAASETTSQRCRQKAKRANFTQSFALFTAANFISKLASWP